MVELNSMAQRNAQLPACSAAVVTTLCGIAKVTVVQRDSWGPAFEGPASFLGPKAHARFVPAGAAAAAPHGLTPY